MPKQGGIHSQASIWRHNAEFYRLTGSVCRKCGKTHFPQRFVCAICGSTELEDKQLKHTGVIVHAMYNTARGVVMGYEDVAPQIFCVIKLDDGPFIEAEVVNVSPQFLTQEILQQKGWTFRDSLLGKRVRMVVRRQRKLDNGNLTYGYKFEAEDAP